VYPNAAAAYSLRKLREAYTGNCIEVRRSSDNALQNIGFVNNELDTASLLSFVGSGDGFVSTWYDQSGNNRNTSTFNNSSQPLIVSAGALVTQSGKNSISFNGTSQYMGCNPVFNSASYASIFSIINQDSQITTEKVFFTEKSATASNRIVLAYRLAAAGNTGIGIGGRRISSNAFQTVGNQTWLGDVFLTTSFFKWQDALLESYINGNLDATRTFQTTGITDVNTGLLSTIGSSGAFNLPTNFFNGKISELILYTTDQTLNKTGIETNINNFYNIY
jgi:hypothetical protein